MRPFLLTHALTDVADRVPDQVAVVDARGSMSYAELDRRTNQLANLLRDAGVRRGDRVGLLLNKSTDAIVGIYGILKAGAAYVPLDPFAPVARLAYIARNCGVRCLVTGREKSSTWGALMQAGAPVDRLIVPNAGEKDVALHVPGITCLAQEALEAASEAPLSSPAISQDLAYILYTSGSTGQPKGVMLSHQNALTFVRWCYGYFRPDSADILSNHAPLHFDLTILDIYLAAMAGATLAVVPPEISVFPMQLADFIEQRGITIWYSVPSILSLLVLHANLTSHRLSSLRHIIFAGEVFPTKHLRQLMKLTPHAQFTNLYGPTETNVCTYYSVPILADDLAEPIPIGRAIDDVEVFAVNDTGQRAQPGEVGELYVRGGTVAHGYWGDSERTARAFVANPGGQSWTEYGMGSLKSNSADRRQPQVNSGGRVRFCSRWIL